MYELYEAPELAEVKAADQQRYRDGQSNALDAG